MKRTRLKVKRAHLINEENTYESERTRLINEDISFIRRALFTFKCVLHLLEVFSSFHFHTCSLHLLDEFSSLLDVLSSFIRHISFTFRRVFRWQLSIAIRRQLSIAFRWQLSTAIRRQLSIAIRRQLSIVFRWQLSIAIRWQLSIVFRWQLSIAIRRQLSIAFRWQLSIAIRRQLSIAFRWQLSIAFRWQLSIAVIASVESYFGVLTSNIDCKSMCTVILHKRGLTFSALANFIMELRWFLRNCYFFLEMRHPFLPPPSPNFSRSRKSTIGCYLFVSRENMAKPVSVTTIANTA